MITDEELAELHSNQKLLIKELQRRGFQIEVIDSKQELLWVSYDGHSHIIMDRDCLDPYPVTVLAGDKYWTKKWLARHGYSVVEGEAFLCDRSGVEAALSYAAELGRRNGYPLVVKPVFGSHGDHVIMDLENLCDVNEAIKHQVEALGENRRFIVEHQFEGKEYRFFITNRGNFAVLHRDPAHVFGDGTHTLEELAVSESYKRMHPRINALCPIAIDDEVVRFLDKTGMTLEYIPPEGGKIYMRHASNVAKGGTVEDKTYTVHPSWIRLVKDMFSIFPGLYKGGFDLLIKPGAELLEATADAHRVLELNTNPGLTMHEGGPVNVAGFVVDAEFPESAKPENSMAQDRPTYHDLAFMYERMSLVEDKPGYVLRFLRKQVVGKDVLEIGCGSGKYLSKLCNDARSYIGIDVAQEVLEIAKRKIGASIISQAAAQRLPFPDKQFDVVVATWVFGTIVETDDHSSDRKLALREAMRVCKNGGTIYFVENDTGGQFEAIRGRYPDITRTRNYNDWLEVMGFRPVQHYRSYFKFESLAEARTVVGHISGQTAAQRVLDPRVTHNIVVYELKND